MKKSFAEAILREPYRVFFPLAVICGMIGVGYWSLFGLGFVHTYSGVMHAAIQMQLCMGCYIVGFLMTAFPRMTETKTSTMPELLFQMVLTFIVLALYLTGKLKLAAVFYAFWLLTLGFFCTTRLKNPHSKKKLSWAKAPVEFIWIPAGILFSFVGIFLTVVKFKHFNLSYIGQQIMNQGLVLPAVIGVGSFLGARLTGRFRVPKFDLNQPEGIQKQKIYRLENSLLQMVGVLCFVVSFVLEGFRYTFEGYLLRTLVLTFFFFKSGVLPKWPRTEGFYAWMIWLSFWFVLLGFWGVVSHLRYRVESLHFAFLGGLGLMTYAVSTMIVLTHAGRPEKLRQPLWILWIVLIGVISSLGVRLAAIFFGNDYYKLLSLSSILWLIVGFSWLIFAWPYLQMIPDPQSVRDHHDRMKRAASLKRE